MSEEETNDLLRCKQRIFNLENLFDVFMQVLLLLLIIVFKEVPLVVKFSGDVSQLFRIFGYVYVGLFVWIFLS